jgi:peptidoglycan/xylan/chitin deacetylase (PgdA/CDA1 family)
MLVSGTQRLRRAIGRFRTRIAPGAVILLYHRISQAQTDPWSLCVTPQHFSEHLQVLRDAYLPIGLGRLTEAVRAYQHLPGSVVITFDDGYADNLHQAKPLLEHYDISATVFVISGSVGSEREFWWDELERLILEPEALPDSLSLSIGGRLFNWGSNRPDPLSSILSRAFSRAKSSIIVGEPSDNSASSAGGPVTRNLAREFLYRALWKSCSNLPEGERRHVLDELLAWSAAAPVSRPTHRPVSAEELVVLGKGELIEIGSHTVTHPFLSRLPAVLQEDELRKSRSCLEEIIGADVTSFSYPHGAYSRKTAALTAAAGYTCACSTRAQPVRAYTGSFELPRMMVQDWGGEEFARRLSAWFRN